MKFDRTPTAEKPTQSLLNRRDAAAAWAAFFSCATLALAGCDKAGASTDAVSLDDARKALEGGQTWVFDVREPDEHATGVAAGVRLLPMKQLARRMAEIPKDPGQPVLLICRTQNRSSASLKALREQGYTNVRYVEGGMSEWARRGWPMVKPAALPAPTAAKPTQP
jgi:rhodanese-related sulfurtransferase